MYFALKFQVLLLGVLAVTQYAESSRLSRALTNYGPSNSGLSRRGEVEFRSFVKRDGKPTKQPKSTTQEGQGGTGTGTGQGQETGSGPPGGKGGKGHKGKGNKGGKGDGSSKEFCDLLYTYVDRGMDPKFFTMSAWDDKSEDEYVKLFMDGCYKYLDKVAPEYNPEGPGVKYFKQDEPMVQVRQRKYLVVVKVKRNSNLNECPILMTLKESTPVFRVPMYPGVYAGACVAFKVLDESWYGNMPDKNRPAVEQFFKTPAETTTAVSSTVPLKQFRKHL